MPVVVLSALTGDHVADLSAAPRVRADGCRSRLVGRRQVDARQRAARRAATGDGDRSRSDDSRGRHTTTHRELFELPGGALLIDTPGIRSLEIAGADEGVDTAFEDIAELGGRVPLQRLPSRRSEPGCAVRAAIDDGRLSRDRFASHVKLERELAHAERKTDARADAEYRKRWRNVNKQVSRHMRAKYGEAR